MIEIVSFLKMTKALILQYFQRFFERVKDMKMEWIYSIKT